MLKKTITYQTLDGETVAEEFYFGISKAQLIEMQVQHGEEGYQGYLQRIVDTKDSVKMLETFKDIIAMSYGRRSEDGKRFIKNTQLLEEFESSPAYDELLLSFYTVPGAASEFAVGIMPNDMAEAIEKAAKDNPDIAAALAAGNDDAPEKQATYLNELSPAQIKELPEDMFKMMKSRTQMSRLSQEQLQACFAR